MDQEPLASSALSHANSRCSLRTYASEERTRAALMLLLGTETEHTTRMQAMQRLVRQGPTVLPLFLSLLHTMPEITTPSWPQWPPQYEYCSRLLYRLCRKSGLSLNDIMSHAIVQLHPGPVLWVTILEASKYKPTMGDEHLLCAGLEVEWVTVRYAAAIALATFATKTPLAPETLHLLQKHQHTQEVYEVRLAASYTLLHSGEDAGLCGLLQLLESSTPSEIQRASAFVLATKLEMPLSPRQKEVLQHHLLAVLINTPTEIALFAARALRHAASPNLIDTLQTMLYSEDEQNQIHILTALEAIALRAPLRTYLRHTMLPAYLLTVLHSQQQALRHQAAYTLGAIGGEYIMAAFGTILLDPTHPGHLQVIESLSIFHKALHRTQRTTIVRWLICCARHAQEETQLAALEALTHLLWRARTHGPKRVWYDLSQEILQAMHFASLLHATSIPTRLYTIELIGMLDSSQELLIPLYQELLILLQTDRSSDIRANIALLYGQCMFSEAIPHLIPAVLDQDEQVAGAALVALERMATYQRELIAYVIGELCWYGSSPSQPDGPLIAYAHDLHKRIQRHLS